MLNEYFTITTAPSAYDYGYTDELAMVYVQGRSNAFRIVGNADEADARYQADRYASGAYVAATYGDLSEALAHLAVQF